MGVKIKHMSANTAKQKRLNLHNVRCQQLIENKRLDLYNSLRKVDGSYVFLWQLGKFRADLWQ